MGEKLSVKLKSDLAELERLAQIVAEFGERHRLSSQALFHANLALEEILANVISYAYGDSKEHHISVCLLVEEGELTVEVEDDGRPFNPLEAPEPDIQKPLEERRAGGLGIHLVRNLMDRLEYQRQDGRNLLIMVKKVVGGKDGHYARPHERYSYPPSSGKARCRGRKGWSGRRRAGRPSPWLARSPPWRRYGPEDGASLKTT
ncbi:MAG: ATP-binding protein [Gammaproteobacteria bacterium]